MLLPLPGYEAMPAGTVLEHRMVLRHVSAGELGVFMAGLRRFAEDPRFGAHRAHGCGRVTVEYAVKRIDGVDARPVGAVSIDPGAGKRTGAASPSRVSPGPGSASGMTRRHRLSDAVTARNAGPSPRRFESTATRALASPATSRGGSAPRANTSTRSCPCQRRPSGSAPEPGGVSPHAPRRLRGALRTHRMRRRRGPHRRTCRRLAFRERRGRRDPAPRGPARTPRLRPPRHRRALYRGPGPPFYAELVGRRLAFRRTGSTGRA